MRIGVTSSRPAKPDKRDGVMHVPLDAPESAFSFQKKTDASGEEGREARPLAGSRRTRQHCRGYAVTEVNNFLGARYFQNAAGLHQREVNHDDG